MEYLHLYSIDLADHSNVIDLNISGILKVTAIDKSNPSNVKTKEIEGVGSGRTLSRKKLAKILEVSKTAPCWGPMLRFIISISPRSASRRRTREIAR